MLFILSILASLAFVLLFTKIIKKYSVLFYLLATAIALFFMMYMTLGNIKIPEKIYTYVIRPLSQGTISTALFSIVMWIGALDRKNKVIKKLFSIRGEMSIIACILALSHNIYYGFIFLPTLFTNPMSMGATYLSATITTIILNILMIPLMATSFITIRKRIKYPMWKKIQRMAYVFYMLMYVHIMIVFVPNIGIGTSYVVNVVVYSVVFLGYAIVRVSKYIKEKR